MYIVRIKRQQKSISLGFFKTKSRNEIEETADFSYM